ncbi:MAG: hypothetical protein JWQ10_1487 [Herbaspirillum sp.]|nr:hypothetical protein [Herbaspirillum sp.]
MNFWQRLTSGFFVIIWLLGTLALPAAYAKTTDSSDQKVAEFSFDGVDYFHRWSKNGQNEFTPKADGDLNRWNDMVTINVLDVVKDGDQLAATANKVLSNYQDHGKVLRTDSKPKIGDHSAEHFIAAVLGDPAFLEAVFARFILVDGAGMVVVYSHRFYGQQVGPAMAVWLKENGIRIDTILMSWKDVPTSVALKSMPQN